MELAVVIPALNEEAAIGHVLRDIPSGLADEIVVVDNGSRDNTAAVARSFGATVLHEHRRGYGAACLRAIEYLKSRRPEIVVFLDGDHSDYPEEMARLIQPIEAGQLDMVLGSRIRGKRSPGAMLFHSYLGNIFCCALINCLHRSRFSDLGPFRAIRFDKLLALDMQDRNYGWTAEMQIKVVQRGLRVGEVPVNYRPRTGQSKVSGTMRGTLGVAFKIIWLAVKLRFMASQK